MDEQPSDGDNRDRDAVQNRRPRQWVDRAIVGEHVRVDTGTLGGHVQPGSWHSVTPPVRQAHDTGADVLGDFDDRIDLTHARRDSCSMSVAHAEPRCVIGVHLKSAARFALHQHFDVVHP